MRLSWRGRAEARHDHPMKTIVLTAVIAIAASVQAGAQTRTPAPKTPPVKELYGSMCQACHGPDGVPPIKEMGFVGRAWKTKTIAASAKTIREGVAGTAMLPFKGRLTEQQIVALARYVRSLDKKPIKK